MNKYPAQCFFCQWFEHSSLHCRFTPRWMNCAGKHLTKDCLKSQEKLPKCVNCNGLHMTYYKICSSLLQEKEKRRSLRPNIPRIHRLHQLFSLVIHLCPVHWLNFRVPSSQFHAPQTHMHQSPEITTYPRPAIQYSVSSHLINILSTTVYSHLKVY